MPNWAADSGWAYNVQLTKLNLNDLDEDMDEDDSDLGVIVDRSPLDRSLLIRG
jgi:hypothetical protein